MSVDRLDHADIGRLCVLHDQEAEIRPSVNTFYGWYEFTAGLARSGTMCVKYSCTEENPWHSLVCLPENINIDGDDLLACCNVLASETEWFPRPIRESVKRDIEDASAGLDL